MALRTLALATCLASSALPALAFRSCPIDPGDAFSARTQYTVGEIQFNAARGEASGTETTYNHSNALAGGFRECHVTYQFAGSYEAASGTLVLQAERTNYSGECPADLLALDYPPERLYARAVHLADNGDLTLRYADNGEWMASGDWRDDAAVYRTGERCLLF